jgi:hypothetical protein
MYSSYSFITPVLDGGEWSASRPRRVLPPGKGPPVPIGQEAGWASEPVWTQRLEEKSRVSAGYRTSKTVVPTYSIKITTSTMVKFSLVTGLWVARLLDHSL